MEKYLRTPIKELISKNPPVGTILEEFGIGCVPCSVDTCFLLVPGSAGGGSCSSVESPNPRRHHEGAGSLQPSEDHALSSPRVMCPSKYS